MVVKRYHARDMQQAMDTVIKELGSDAVILNSRKVRKKGLKNLFRKPIMEVMVAYDPADVPAVRKLTSSSSADAADRGQITKPAAQDRGQITKPAAQENGQITKPAAQENGQITKPAAQENGQMERLDKRIDSIDVMLSDFFEKLSYAKRDIKSDYPEEVQKLLQKMIDNQVGEEPAHLLAKQAEQILRRRPDSNAAEIMEHLILEQLGKPEPIMHKKYSQQVILTLGPTGVGKTTTIVKLAADFSVKQKKKVGIINTDTYRIGAQEQLQKYADILDVPIQVIYWADELEAALENMSDRDVIFVDTAGKHPGDEQHKEDVIKMARILKPEDTLLCISASTGFASIKEVVDTYGFLDKYRLLVTKLDETKYRGSILNISWYTGKPLAYVTTGQSVPDDIEIVDVDAVAQQILCG